MRTDPPRVDSVRHLSLQLPLHGGRLPRAGAIGIAISGSLLAITGVMLGLFRYVMTNANELSVYPHPWWRYVVMLHVLCVPPFFFFVGSIWWRHAVRHWHNRVRRVSGGGVVALSLVVAVSGYALYFIGAEGALSIGRLVHSGGGALAILVYSHHALLGFRALRVERTSSR